MRDLHKLKSRFIEVNGTRIHVRVPRAYQAPDAPVVVLVHGVGVSSRYMAPLACQLASYVRVYAPDLPGFGRSSKPRRILDIPGLADALAAWMDAEGIDDAVVFGNSVGCQTATELAIRHPGRVRGLVLQGPTMEAPGRNFFQQSGKWLRAGPHEPPSLNAVLVRDYIDCGIGRALRTARLALRHPIEERLPAISVPTLVVRGNRDPIATQAWCEHLVTRLSKGRLKVIGGPAHALNYSAPMALTRVMLPFIREVFGDGSGRLAHRGTA